MSNTYPPMERQIPAEEDERPVKHLNGVILANDAFHCRPKDLWPNDMEHAKPEWVPYMELYLANFCRPIQSIAKEVKCVACDKQLTGAYAYMADWKSQNAVNFDPGSPTLEGKCDGCGYPVRCKHTIKLPNGQVLVRLDNFPLCYHPSATERKH